MMRKKLEFRTLKASEIDCRIATVGEKGLSLLLYKDARVDQNILDESVGPMNWQRSHSRENANCTVSIWDDEKKQWVSKEDTGKESNAEAEKGLASDSFKRACFNWGIGRELYTAPFIWIPATKCNIKESGRKDRNGKMIMTCYDRFKVSHIGYDAERNIVDLEIQKNDASGEVVFCMKKKPGEAEKAKKESKEPKAKQMIPEEYIEELRSELRRTGVGRKPLMANYEVNDLHDLTLVQWLDAMKTLAKKPDKPKEPVTIPLVSGDANMALTS